MLGFSRLAHKITSPRNRRNTYRLDRVIHRHCHFEDHLQQLIVVWVSAFQVASNLEELEDDLATGLVTADETGLVLKGTLERYDTVAVSNCHAIVIHNVEDDLHYRVLLSFIRDMRWPAEQTFMQYR